MTKEHPITPPPELVQQWLGDYFGCVVNGELSDSEKYLATQAARWGADQELEACVSYVDTHVSGNRARALREARRPKPPSLKEQALKALIQADKGLNRSEWQQCYDIIRHALESLPS